MTLTDFKALSQFHQCELLHKEGGYIGKIKKGLSCSVLYQFFSFYVEITYRQYRYFVASIRYYETPDFSFDYLKQVDLNDNILI